MNTAFAKSLLVALAIAMPIAMPSPAIAASKAELNSSSKSALDKLVATVPAAKALNAKAIAVLVFPSITKAGLMIGGQYGDGVLWQGGKPVGYYNTSGASYGLQAGAQQYGYAMFFMNKKGLDALECSRAASRSAWARAWWSWTKAWARARRPRPIPTTSMPSFSRRKA